MKIRQSNRTDDAAIVRLLRQIADASDDRGGPGMSDEEHLNIISKCHTRVSEQDGAITGMISWRYLNTAEDPDASSQKLAWIMVLGVDGRYHRNGIGKALFENAKHWLEMDGAHFISLNVSSTNAVAQAFYEKVGLAPKSIKMSLALSAAVETESNAAEK